jgi:phosphoadenosine phosphosulfate reductase
VKPPPDTIAPPAAVGIDADAVADELEHRSARAALEWLFETFGEAHYIACSFQKTSSVTVHLATEINPAARFFYLDTDVLFPETYETRDRFAEHFGVAFDSYRDITIEEQAAIHGDELWKRDPDACCGLRKVEPMRRALSSVDAWVSGIRRGDSSTRATAPKFAWDQRFGLWKLNPLADWSESDVWSHVREHRLPYNPLHDRGYPSIGCTHCTQPVAPGADPRDGRWVGTAKSECGIN